MSGLNNENNYIKKKNIFKNCKEFKNNEKRLQSYAYICIELLYQAKTYYNIRIFFFFIKSC